MTIYSLHIFKPTGGIVLVERDVAVCERIYCFPSIQEFLNSFHKKDFGIDWGVIAMRTTTKLAESNTSVDDLVRSNPHLFI